MEIQLLYTSGCHAYRRAMDEIEAALSEAGLPVNFRMTRVDTVIEAKRHKFAGSPSILIDGVDIDSGAKEVKKFSVVACRPYRWKDKPYDWPPKAMIMEALKRAAPR